ncbi:MAG: hypothetical protein L0K86_26190, partial [Actinomycetia bacterium]|nr:hypothetical protein [Actinomycetes bacterium]
ADGGAVSISGGDVTAVGGRTWGAGIGSGGYGSGKPTGSVEISAGDVTAIGGSGAEGIGGGNRNPQWQVSIADCANVNVTSRTRAS